jgi:oxygen-dependent protoporphyrinogen oxidase
MGSIIGRINPKQTVHVIGAGVSGLIIANFLKKKNIPFVIYEKENRVGGLIKTTSTEFGLVESAANAIFTNDDVIDFLNDLNLTYIPAHEKIKRLLVRKNKSLSFPIYIYELPFIFFRLFFKKPPFKKNLTLKEFLSPLLGESFCDEVASTGLLGIYASDSSTIDQETFFPVLPYKSYFQALKHFIQLRKKMREKYKLKASVSFKGGMQEFINRLEEKVRDHIVFEKQIDLKPNAIVCTNADSAAELLNKKFPVVANCLKQISYQAIYTETKFTEVEYKPLHKAFGILFSRKTPFKVYGLLANHEIFPHRVNKGFSYTFIKESNDHNQLDLSQDCLELHFPKSIENHSTTWPKGIPIYSSKRRQLIDEIRNHLEINKVNDIAIFGNYVDGISLREMISMAKEFTQKLEESR